MKTVSIIGIGRIGGGLAIALGRCGWKIENLVTRNPLNLNKIIAELPENPRILTIEQSSLIKSDVIFITTPDAEIERTAQILARKLTINPRVFHTSGALSSNILSDLKLRGCAVGSLHPLVSISDALLAEKRFQGSYFAVEGSPEAVETAEKIVADLGGKSFAVATEFKTLYHAAAVTACGHLVALIDVALEMLSKCGIGEIAGREILLPLIKSTIDNLATQTAAQALTGTFARADLETFQNHVAAIEKSVSPEVLEIYLQLGLRSLPLAEKQGANSAAIEKLRSAVLMAKSKSK